MYTSGWRAEIISGIRAPSEYICMASSVFIYTAQMSLSGHGFMIIFHNVYQNWPQLPVFVGCLSHTLFTENHLLCFILRVEMYSLKFGVDEDILQKALY